MARERWRLLDGEWDFAYDDAERYQRPIDVPFDRKIHVPFPPESRASGIGDPGFHAVVWYRLRVTIEPEERQARLLLHFGAVDYDGAGLRVMHDALPVADCPFGRPSWVVNAPNPDRLVVCHGDACAPNTLMGDDGAFVGHVDIGDLGVADRWADLAIATMSLDWNYPGNYEAALLDAYGVPRDDARIDYYRALWDAG